MSRLKQVNMLAMISSLLLASAFPLQAQANCETAAYNDLVPVGNTRLSVLFWDIYDAELRTDTGRYDNAQQRALRINYLRSISSEDLVDSTAEEWQRLGYGNQQQQQQWLSQLRQMWPDVDKGDCLMMIETAQGHALFYNADGQLGAISDSEFSGQFLAIWLSEQSRFKDERNQLLGEAP